MTYYGRDQDIKEHIALKSFCSLSTTSIYFIVQISKRKPDADITLKGAKYFSISKFPLLKERKYLGSPTSSLFSASTQFITTLQRVYHLSVFTHQFQLPLAIVTKKSHYSLLIFVSAQLKRSSYNRL